jgi:hypothetical protein
MSAALGAEEAALRVRGLASRRRGELLVHVQSIRHASDELDELVLGRSLGELGDQREAVEALLKVEADQMRGMIQRFLREASARLERWNGHAALLARLTAIRDLIGIEILSARQCLGTAMEHEEERYALDSMWDDLEVRFGRIRDQGEDTEGAWSDPTDRKSPYLFFLDSPSGEVLAEVPWAGPIVITHEERRLLEFPPASPFVTHPEVIFIGDLRRRWIEIERRLENPNWNPDQHTEEMSP